MMGQKRCYQDLRVQVEHEVLHKYSKMKMMMVTSGGKQLKVSERRGKSNIRKAESINCSRKLSL